MHKLLMRGRSDSFIVMLPKVRVPSQQCRVVTCSKLVTMVYHTGHMNITIPTNVQASSPSKERERELRRQLKRMQAFAWDAGTRCESDRQEPR